MKLIKSLTIGCVLFSGAAMADLMNDTMEQERRVDTVPTQTKTRDMNTSWNEANAKTVENVKDVQSALSAHGLAVGSIDGVIGPKTRAALRDFQADNGLAVTGSINQETIQKLGLNFESDANQANDIYAE